MPRCEGRPDGPCPDNRMDNTVRGTQGDLMLCPKCDEYRFGKFDTKPGTRSAAKAQANKHSIAASTPSTTINASTVNTADNKKADAPSLSEVETLREEVISLRAFVASLEAKVSYLLSFVGAVDCEPTPNLVQTPVDDNWTTVGPNGRPVKSSTTSTSASVITNGSATVRPKLYPTAAKSSSKVLQSCDSLRQDIVAAVYVDMHEEKSVEPTMSFCRAFRPVTAPTTALSCPSCWKLNVSVNQPSEVASDSV